jgi:dihydroneopterin triphosphate diphosphatase
VANHCRWWRGQRNARGGRQEGSQEGGIQEDFPLLALSTVIPVPVAAFGQNNSWNGDLYVVPKYCFGALLQRTTLSISSEHTEYQWLAYEQAQALIRYDGERTALWELHARLLGKGPRGLGRQGL